MEKEFTVEDQNKFSKLSGDYNPLHTDEMIARRLIFGKQVVHGIHLLIWGLDGLAKYLDKDTIYLNQLNCKFKRPVGVGEAVKTVLEHNNEQVIIKIVGKNNNSTLSTFKLKYSYIPMEQLVEDFNYFTQFKPPSSYFPERILFDKEFAYNQSYPIELGEIDYLKEYKYLLKKVPYWQIVFLLNSTRLVGMKCPGLNSIFSSLNVDFNEHEETTKVLNYNLKKYYRKISRLDFSLSWGNTVADIITYIRPEKKEQSCEEIKVLCGDRNYENINAVVIGGSRGIGEVTTKILALNGANVLFTFYRGKEEAEKIVSELSQMGIDVKAEYLDIRNIDSTIKRIENFETTHLFYFPTPQIFSGDKLNYNNELFEKFSAYYIRHFYEIFFKLKEQLKFVFYPSSIAIEEQLPDMKEYCMAKIAGEELCKNLEILYTHIDFFYPRLPRTETDQTVSLIKIKSANPIELMLNYLDDFLSK